MIFFINADNITSLRKKGEYIMKAVITMLLSFYSASLVTFLVFIRRGFLQMCGENCIPSIDLNIVDEETEPEIL